MRICVIGGGKVGYYLSKTLLEHGHRPVIVDPDAETAKRVANELDIAVIRGDGTSIASLKAAKAHTCHAMVCVSGKDEVNLIASQLGKEKFGIARTVVRVNNPKNVGSFRALGVDIVISSTQSIVSLIEQEVETDKIRHLLSLHNGSASLVELQIPDTFARSGDTLAELPIPPGCVIVSVERGDDYIIPNGKTQVFAGDTLLLVVEGDKLHDFLEQWNILKEL